MRLHLISSQFSFESGNLFVWPGTRNLDVTSVPLATLERDFIELPSLNAGRVVLVGYDIIVQSRIGPPLRRTSAFVLQPELGAADRALASVDVQIDFRAFARLAVAKPSSGEYPIIGVALDDVTLELTPGAEGHVDVLLPSGKYLAYTLSDPPISKWITVPPDTADAGVFHLSA
jgi:hypothetical protein